MPFACSAASVRARLVGSLVPATRFIRGSSGVNPARRIASSSMPEAKNSATLRCGEPPGGIISSRMRILLSNDDGYFAPGLAALAESLAQAGDITVVAPERDRSGASNSLTLDRPLMLSHAHNGFHYVNGTPTDCVHMAVTGLLDFEPDVIVSDINSGSNMGDDTLYSGTVAAATEGYLLGIPSIAVSLSGHDFLHYETAARVARTLVERLARAPFGAPVLLNVNVPDLPFESLSGFEVTR